jgi:serine/threonine protein kinase
LAQAALERFSELSRFRLLKKWQSKSKSSVILNACSVYERLAGATGFLSVREVGCDNGRHFFVMDLLGDSIRQLFRRTNHHFSLKTVLILADQMLARVQYLHAKGFVHRDLKPANFLIGLHSNANLVYLIDFGLTTPFATAATPGLCPFAGTPCWASIAAQSGRQPSRRDDLESLGYILVYLATGSLPWRKLPVDKSVASAAILETKLQTPIHELCKGLPMQFATYMEAVRGLGFADVPDYAGYRRLFRELFLEREFLYDYWTEWIALKQQFSFVLEPRVVLRPSPLVSERRANSFQRTLTGAGVLRCFAHKRRDPKDAKAGPFGMGRSLRAGNPPRGLGMAARRPNHE